MKSLCSFAIIILSVLTVYGQNASFGVGAAAFQSASLDGVITSANVRYQFAPRVGWQTEVGYGIGNRLDTYAIPVQVEPAPTWNPQLFTERDERTTFVSAKTSILINVINDNGFILETALGVGMLYDDSRELSEVFSGGIFLAAQISSKLVAGLPINYNVSSGISGDFVDAGLMLRFHF